MRDAKDRAAEALQTVGLGDRMHHEPNQLSGGQRQRVAIARALITDPAILLADEPTGNLDSKTGEEIMALAQRPADSGTIIIVTHEPDIARHCPSEIHMRDGRIVPAPGHCTRRTATAARCARRTCLVGWRFTAVRIVPAAEEYYRPAGWPL